MQSKVPMKTIMSYGSAAIGYNFVFMAASSFLQLFYTNVAGISLAAVGTIMLVARLWDGINDPLMGTLVDRSSLKGGRYRPFIRLGILPLAVTFVLLFWMPNLSITMKFIYALITYNLFGMAYTFANIPYMAMQSTISTDPNERTKIITIKNAFTLVGIVMAMGLVPGLAIGDKGPNAAGFLKVGIIGSILVVITMIITFWGTKSHDKAASGENHKITWKERLQAIGGNPALIILAITLFIISIISVLMGSAGNYYFINIQNRPDLVMPFTMASAVAMILAMALMPVIMKMEKKNAMTMGLLVFGIGSLIMFFIPDSSPNLFLLVNALRSIGTGIAMILIFSMIADSCDWALFKTGKHQGGIVFSTSTFMQKAASGIGAALLNGLLILVGFNPTAAVQSAQAGTGIKLLLTIIPGLFVVLNALLILFLYPLTKAKMEEIAQRIEERN